MGGCSTAGKETGNDASRITLQVLGRAKDSVISLNTGEGFLCQAGCFSRAAGKSPSSKPCHQLQNLLLRPAFAETCSGWGDGGCYLLSFCVTTAYFLFFFVRFLCLRALHLLFNDTPYLNSSSSEMQMFCMSRQGNCDKWLEYIGKALKILRVLHEKINKTQNFFSKQGLRRTNSCKSVWF